MKKGMIIGILLMLAAASVINADDTEIYRLEQAAVSPNVMIIFDTSGSMDDTIIIQYDPNTDYDESTQNQYDDSADITIAQWSIYERHVVQVGCDDETQYEKHYDDARTDLTGCDDVKDDLLTQGYSNGKYCGGSAVDWHLGNYINYEACSSCSETTKLAVAKEAMKDLIDVTDGVNFGLMRFDSSGGAQGGEVVFECQEATDANKTALKTAIDGLNGSGGTPLAETLAEAGLYFAGKKSWFNSGTYTSPISEICQENYVILMTDGDATSDRDTVLWEDDAYMSSSTSTPYDGVTLGDYDCDQNTVSGGDCDRNATKEWTETPSFLFGTIYSDHDYLDDVAKYLYDTDLRTDIGSGDYVVQNIQTFTIGFDTDHELLVETALHGNGIDFSDIDADTSTTDAQKLDLKKARAAGKYIQTDTSSGLLEALQRIVTTFVEADAVFVAPVVPVSRMNRTFAGDRIYLGFFKPKDSGRWHGNIKKYGLHGTTGEVLDAAGNAATYLATDSEVVAGTEVEGAIKDSARSYWSLSTDGPSVDAGGVGSLVPNTSRNVYTYAGTANTGLTHADNNFDDDVDLSSAPGGPYTLTNALINDIRGEDAPNPAGTSRTGEDEWILGDIVHSEPAVVHYLNPDGNDATDDDTTVVYAGGNDGMLHCFLSSVDTGDDIGYGTEVWSFIPPYQLGNLSTITDDTIHDYFIDGSPVVYEGANKILIFSERRGGSYYYALNVDDYDSPSWMYAIGPDSTSLLGNTVAGELGQSWSKPKVLTIATGPEASGTIPTETVFLMGGGYDTNNDIDIDGDDDQCPSNSDSKGRSVYTVDVTDGSLSSLAFTNDGTNNTDMTHAILEAAGFDPNNDGIDTRVYAADVGGNIFAYGDDIAWDGSNVTEPDPDGTWTKVHLFSAPTTTHTCTYDPGGGDVSTTINLSKKMFYSPDAIREDWGEYIFIGTGDRSNPNKTDVENRLYAIKNKWDSTILGSGPLTESNLVDVTTNQIQQGTATAQAAVKAQLDAGYGWFIKLDENAGEKIVASPVVFGGIVYFTTYTPPSSTSATTDPCAAGSLSRGEARLYAVNYETGGAAYDFSSDPEYTEDAAGNMLDEDGNEVTDEADAETVDGYGRKDRSKSIGTSIPSAPVIAVLESGPRVFVGVEGGVISMDTVSLPDMNLYYWRQIFE